MLGECQVNVKSQSELDIGGRETCTAFAMPHYLTAFFNQSLLSSSGSSLTSWLTPRQVYEMSGEDPEIGFVMG